MHTVVETPYFTAAAKREHLSDEEIADIVTYLAENPDVGVVMPGTGGARKLRFAARGKGKSGGFRVVTFYADETFPVFLLNVYSKSVKEDMSQAEKNEFRQLLAMLLDVYRGEKS